MKTTVQLSIPTPCHQNWHVMDFAEKGKFCNSCKKNVIDFTMKSDASILLAISKEEHLCGRFLPNQLDRILMERHEKSYVWHVGFASFLGFIGLGSQAILAQNKSQIEIKNDSLIKSEVDVDKEFNLSGIIVDDKNNPVAGAIVRNMRSGKFLQTDLSGKFTISTFINDKISIQFIGFDTIYYLVKNVDNNSTKLILQMQYSHAMIGDVVIIHKKPSFFRKITRPFRKLFKKKTCTTSSLK